MKLHKKTFIVTGAGGGIGAALVHELMRRGSSVAAVDRNKDHLEALRKSVNENDAARLSLHVVDITDRAAVEALPKEVAATHNTVDGLINNAGIIQPFVNVHELDYETIERVMKVNFYGSLYIIKTFLPGFLARPEAYIVNVSSMGGFLPVPGQSIYGASKAALKLMSEGLFAELQDTQVYVSTAFPGATKTDITTNSAVEAPTVDAASAGAVMMISPQDAARIIIDGMVRRKPLIYTGKDSRAMQRLYRLSPVKATKLIAKQMKSLLK